MEIKNKLIIVWTLVLIFVSSVLVAEVIDKPVATIKYTKTEVISLEWFKQQIDVLETQTNKPLTFEEKKKVLQSLVDEKILIQAANKEGIRITDAEIAGSMNSIKAPYEKQYNRSFTDEEFKQLIESAGKLTGVSYEKFMEQVKNKVLLEKYVRQSEHEIFDSVQPPTEQEIEDYFMEKRAAFITPEMLRIKQILILSKGLTKEKKDLYLKKINSIYDDIKSGKKSFDDYWEVYLDGETGKIGGLNMDIWRRDDDSRKNTYGKKFYDRIFRMEKNEMSLVEVSDVGFHIIKILDKIPFRTLELNDKIPPTNTSTVKDQIFLVLSQMKNIEASQNAVKSLLEKVKKNAVIKIYDENLKW
ncbi:MAG: SurA N-terminal domain-containing protein [Spirochaetales bacterium]|nr:SurA N-terminal domain-containing protein [Spirochaetales bacterium]